MTQAFRKLLGKVDLRVLLALSLIFLTVFVVLIGHAQNFSADETVITNVTDLEVWLNGPDNQENTELVIDFEEFEPVSVRNCLIPVISNSVAVFPVHLEQKNGNFRLFNADLEQIYQNFDEIIRISANFDAILVPLSEWDQWLYVSEILEAQAKVPMVGTFDPKTSNDWNFSGENFQ